MRNEMNAVREGEPLAHTVGKNEFQSPIASSLNTPPFTPDITPDATTRTSPEPSTSPGLSNSQNVPPQASNDIAVVGMACRVAGGNNTPEKLWEFLMDKKDGSGEIDPLRWEPYRHRDARNAKVLEKTTSRGYFVDGIEDFDCSFFNVSPKEAEMMDPQQRLALEVCWEALEAAGIPPQSLAGSNTAVYMGVNSDDYGKLLLEDLPGIEAWMGIGTAYCGIPNRISYHLDLMGPSTAVDAACASSLVAIHHGRQSLLLGETNVAIVGGVNALYGPGLTKVLDKAGAVSPEGLCRSFDDESSGYGRGEGAGIVILKRMTDALENRDNIVAVLKGSAVAQDGRTNGIMAPNGKAQELVANLALKAGGVDPLTVGYVEAHATSTPVGDPAEVAAISSIYGKDRGSSDPCLIGSIKPNIGHLEAGAGVMGFMKAVMAVNKGLIPPQANLNKLNSRVNWGEAGVKVVREPTAWKSSEAIRRAGICSYGYGGSVSHAVIEEFRNDSESFTRPGGVDGENQGEPTVLLLSAPQEKRLSIQADALSSWILDGGSKHSLSSIAATLTTRRGHHDYRCAFVVNSHEDAVKSLRAFSKDATNSEAISNRVLDSSNTSDSVWVFSGHGAQWEEMGKELLSNAVFREAISPLDPIVETEAGFSALQALKEGDIGSSDRVQVLTYVMQIGLAAVLRSKGAVPNAVIGHSVGEIAASVVAGALTANEGALIVCRRAALYRRVIGLGAMVLVSSPFAEIQEELGHRHDVAAAIDSSPTSCVVSGAADIVAEYTEMWKTRGIKVIKVKSDIAFHSPILDDLVAPLFEGLAKCLKPRAPSTRLYSTSLLDPRAQDPRDADYWINNMVRPVLLTHTVEAAVDDGYRVFLEVSSHPIVSHSVEETILNKDIDDSAIVPLLNRGKPTGHDIVSSIAQLHCVGVSVSWDSQPQMAGDWAHEVPTTTWSHQRYVKRVESGPLNPENAHDCDKHDLLGQRIPILGENLTVFVTKLDESTRPFPGKHPLHGTEIVPAAVLVNTFYHGTGKRSLHNIVLRVPVALSAPRDVQVTVQQGQVKLTSRLVQSEEQAADDSWLTHTTARYAEDTSSDEERGSVVDVAAVKARIGSQLKDDFSMNYLSDVGVSAMGFPWAVTEHFGTTNEMIARVDVAPGIGAESPLDWDAESWAPIFDAATSIGSTLFFDEPRLRMPAQIGKVTILPSAKPPKVGYIHVQEATQTELAVHTTILDDDGRTLASIEDMRFAEIEGTIGASGSVESLVHQVSWPPMSLTEEPLALGHMMIISSDSEAVEKCHRVLKSRTASIQVYPSVKEIPDTAVLSSKEKHTKIVLYIPGKVDSFDGVPEAGGRFCTELLDTVKYAAGLSDAVKVFVMTDNVMKGESATALAQAPLHGLGRIIASEQSAIWGALIDNEDDEWTFPLQAIKYAQGGDVIRISDGVARAPVLRRLARDKLLQPTRQRISLPRPEGTYLITGGLGALGIEVANFLVEKGARRLVLLSRRSFPPRGEWKEASGATAETCRALEKLEAVGATVYILSVDIAAHGSKQQLQTGLDALALPPVLGVVHAAGVLEDQLVLDSTTDSFDRVLAPKVAGGMALHQAFPVGALDFFVLFSSCGQLFGFPGQGSYASGNAFLDTLASHRREQGDNSMAFQWTSWRGMGMAASTDFINAELESKGITDVTRDEAFRAWEHLGKYDMDHGVVLRSRVLDADEPLPASILNEIAVRQRPTAETDDQDRDSASELPTSGPALLDYLDVAIRTCVAQTLQLPSPDDVDARAALSDLGVDSVMAVALRTQLQKTMGVKVPPTLMWSLPTTSHLQKWFAEQMEGKQS